MQLSLVTKISYWSACALSVILVTSMICDYRASPLLDGKTAVGGEADDDAPVLMKLYPFFDMSEKRFGYMQGDGKVCIPPVYYSAGYFSYDRAPVCFEQNLSRQGDQKVLQRVWKYIRSNGSDAFGSTFEAAMPFEECLGVVKNNGKWGAVDIAGETVVECQYEAMRQFSEGLAAVMINGKWGFVDVRGKLRIPLKYDEVLDFSEGLAAVKDSVKGGWRYVRPNGDAASGHVYEIATRFHEGKAKVEQGNEEFWIWHDGTIVNEVPKVVVVKEKEEFVIDLPVYKDGIAAVTRFDRDGRIVDRRGTVLFAIKNCVRIERLSCEMWELELVGGRQVYLFPSGVMVDVVSSKPGQQ